MSSSGSWEATMASYHAPLFLGVWDDAGGIGIANPASTASNVSADRPIMHARSIARSVHFVMFVFGTTRQSGAGHIYCVLIACCRNHTCFFFDCLLVVVRNSMRDFRSRHAAPQVFSCFEEYSVFWGWDLRSRNGQLCDRGQHLASMGCGQGRC